MDLVNNIVTLLQGLGIILASFTAIWGINSWRREYSGKRKIELAEDVLISFYKFRDIIRYIRNPFGYPGEGFKKSENKDSRTAGKYDAANVVFYRFNEVRSDFSELEGLKYRFITYFGKEKTGGPGCLDSLAA